MRDTRIALAPYTFVALFLILAILAIVDMLHSQATTFKPSEVQQLKLQVAQRDAWLAQRDYLDSQRRYQEAVAALNRLGEDVKKENAWPDAVIFNADRIEFAVPPPNTARPGAPGPPSAPTDSPSTPAPRRGGGQ